MKNSLNTLKDFPLSRIYYIKHPWKIFSHAWDNCKAAWQRATKGFAASDVWDLDHYLLTLLPAMLRKLADEGMSYPGIAPFETPEKWETWLREMADKLESLQEDWAETRNEYDEPYFHALEEHRRVRRADPSIIRYDTYNDEDLEILHDKWLARVNELNQEQKDFTIKTFEELGRYLGFLWS